MSITVTIAGRLTKDAELRQAGSSQVCSFSVASDTGFGDRKQTHFFNCSLWGRQGEVLAQYLRKGGAVTVVGEFSEREYNGKQYKELRAHTVDLQGSKGDNQSQGNYQNNYQQPNNQQPNSQPPQNQFSNPQAQNYAQNAVANAPQPNYQNQGNQFGSAQGFSAQPQNYAPQNQGDIDSEIPF